MRLVVSTLNDANPLVASDQVYTVLVGNFSPFIKGRFAEFNVNNVADDSLPLSNGQ